jgi:hypothetical protein
MWPPNPRLQRTRSTLLRSPLSRKPVGVGWEMPRPGALRTQGKRQRRTADCGLPAIHVLEKAAPSVEGEAGGVGGCSCGA